MLKRLLGRLADRQVAGSIVWERRGSVSLATRRLAIFAHFDPANRIEPYVVHYLARLAAEGFSIIFVSTAEGLPEGAADDLAQYCAHMMCKKNTGFDFGAWKTGLRRFDRQLGDYDCILLVNDSCYAPACDWRPMFAAFEAHPEDICGVTFNTEGHRKPHLQSYFLWVNHSTRNLQFLRSFFGQVRFLKDKRKLIKAYEVGFTQDALRQGLSIFSWVNNDVLEARFGIVNQNVTITHPVLLLKHKLSPLIKRALFKDPAQADVCDALIAELQTQEPAFALLLRPAMDQNSA